MAELKKNQLNQVAFVMVDATDFASIESSLGAASVVGRYYGMNHGGSAATTSGALSKACSVIHSGIFRQTIKASEGNYDFIVLRFTATGCADQVMTFNMVDYDDSDLMSRISDFYSDFQSRVPKAVATNSQLSDLASDLKSYLAGLSGTGSDIYSMLSDFYSDFGSRVPKAVATNSQLSDLHSDLRSYLVVMSSTDSNVYSMLSDFYSDFGSRVPKAIATNSQLSDLHSDLKSAMAAITATIGASELSNIGVAVWANAIGSDVNSKIGKLASRITKPVASQSLLSDVHSDLLSYIGAAATASDVASAVWGEHYAAHVAASTFGSAFRIATSQISDIDSAVSSQFARTSDYLSDLRSLLTTTGVELSSDCLSNVRSTMNANASDLRSVVSALKNLTVSAISDIGSRIWGEKYMAHVGASTFGSAFRIATSRVSDIQSAIATGFTIDAATVSDLKSAIAAGPAATVTASDISLIAQGVWADATASDVTSKVGKLASRITKPVATNSQLSDLASDLKSYLAGLSGTASDIYSMLSDVQSDFQSRVPKAAATNSQLSDLASDIKSYLAGLSNSLSALQSDFQSRVPKLVATNSQVSDLASDLKSYLTGLSGTGSDIYSMLSDLQSDFQSRVPKAVATNSQLSDLHSDLKSYMAGLSDMISNVDSGMDANFASESGMLSDIQSQLTAYKSDLSSQLTVIQASASDINSDLTLVRNALINRQEIMKSTGDVNIYDDTGGFVGTVAAAYTSTASNVSRKRLVP